MLGGDGKISCTALLASLDSRAIAVLEHRYTSASATRGFGGTVTSLLLGRPAGPSRRKNFSKEKHLPKQSISLKGHDDLVNQMVHLTERYQNRITFHDLWFPKRYIENEIHINLYFRVRDG